MWDLSCMALKNSHFCISNGNPEWPILGVSLRKSLFTGNMNKAGLSEARQCAGFGAVSGAPDERRFEGVNRIFSLNAVAIIEKIDWLIMSPSLFRHDIGL
jgi:hypothetical protein